MRRVESDSELSVQQRFCDMYEATLADVYGFLSLRLGGNRAQAEDLTAETYVAAVRHFNAGRSDEVTISWLRTVARRRLVDHWRRQGTAMDKVVQLAPDPPPEPSSWVDRDAVKRALSKLREEQRQALVLRHMEGYAIDTIAALMGRSYKGTESLLSRARVAFRAAYEEASDD